MCWTDIHPRTFCWFVSVVQAMSNLCITYLILLDHFVIIFNLDLFLTVQAGSRHLIKCCPLKPLSQSRFQTWCSFSLNSSFLSITFELVICAVASYTTFSRTPLKPGLDAAQHEHIASTGWNAWGEEAQHHPAIPMGTTLFRHQPTKPSSLKSQPESTKAQERSK